MPDRILERILDLISKGYDICIRPDFMEGCIEIRLTKNNWTTAKVIDPKASRQSYAWNSDEDWFLYNLLWLEMNCEGYMKRIAEMKGEN